MRFVIVEHEDRFLALESVWKHSLKLSNVLEKLDSFGGRTKLDVVIFVTLTEWEAYGTKNSCVEALLSPGVEVRIAIRRP